MSPVEIGFKLKYFQWINAYDAQIYRCRSNGECKGSCSGPGVDSNELHLLTLLWLSTFNE